jgi:predicted ribosomally synthesized peptide with SipW-like signal peptide
VRKRILFGVIAIVALVAIVAGATYAVFTHNVQSDVQTFASGTVDVQVNGQNDIFDTTLDMDTMEAGDWSSQPITITNVGTLPVNWELYVDWGYDLDDIFHCDGANSMNVWASQYTGGPLAQYDQDTVTLTAQLPLAAANSCQNKTGQIRVSVHAVQDSNLAGFTCIKLVYKDDASNWLPYQHGDPGQLYYAKQHGNLCYKPTGNVGELRLVMNAYGLTANANYQLALNGPGGCVSEDTNFAGMPGDLFVAGYWDWVGPYLRSGPCTSGWEGVYNYAGVHTAVQADGSGNISHDMVVTGLPPGQYNDVKYVIKEVTGTLPGTAWTPKLMEIRQLNFSIP